MGLCSRTAQDTTPGQGNRLSGSKPRDWENGGLTNAQQLSGPPSPAPRANPRSSRCTLRVPPNCWERLTDDKARCTTNVKDEIQRSARTPPAPSMFRLCPRSRAAHRSARGKLGRRAASSRGARGAQPAAEAMSRGSHALLQGRGTRTLRRGWRLSCGPPAVVSAARSEPRGACAHAALARGRAGLHARQRSLQHRAVCDGVLSPRRRSRGARRAARPRPGCLRR